MNVKREDQAPMMPDQLALLIPYSMEKTAPGHGPRAIVHLFYGKGVADITSAHSPSSAIVAEVFEFGDHGLADVFFVAHLLTALLARIDLSYLCGST